MFARPLLLWGLLGVLVPILIHLLGRRRARTVPVATLRFLERARAKAAARWRVRRLLLLLARCAALACLALLFAGPGCRERGRSGGPATWVLLLDTSPSMGARKGGVVVFERARAELLRVVDRSDPRDRFLVATTLEAPPDREDSWRRGFTVDRGAVRRSLLTAEVEYGPHRVDRALERAFRLLEGVEGGQVVLATDLQASAWGDQRIGGAGRVPLRLADVGIQEPENAWVADVQESGGVLRVKVGSSLKTGQGPTKRTVRVSLEDGQKLTAFTDGAEASFRFRAPPGVHTGEAAVEPGGDLPLDDRMAFAGRGASKVRVLMVNGDPRGFEIRDELLFVRKALASAGRFAERFEVREVRAADFTESDLDNVDAALLANPGTLSAPLTEALRARMERGLGVIVTAGDRWKPGDAGKSLGAVLAAPLRDVIDLEQGGGAGRRGEAVDTAFFTGPLTPFLSRDAGDLTQTRVWTYWVPEAKTVGSAIEVLMRLENGAPLLLERKAGKGRTLLLTTTVDKDGADLCLQAAFVPWLERLLLHAAGRLRPSVGRQVAAGYPLALPYTVPVSIEGPGGLKAAWAPGAPAFVPPSPGAYRVREAEGVVDGFGAGVEARESELTRLDRAGLDARLGSGAYTLGDGAPAGRSEAVGRRDASARYGAGLLVALAAEAVLAARWARRKRAPLESAEVGP